MLNINTYTKVACLTLTAVVIGGSWLTVQAQETPDRERESETSERYRAIEETQDREAETLELDTEDRETRDREIEIQDREIEETRDRGTETLELETEPEEEVNQETLERRTTVTPRDQEDIEAREERIREIRAQRETEAEARREAVREAAQERLQAARERAEAEREAAQAGAEQLSDEARERIRERVEQHLERYFTRYRIATEERLENIADRLESRIVFLEDSQELDLSEARGHLTQVREMIDRISVLIDEAESEAQERLETFEHPSELREIITGIAAELRSDIQEAHSLLVETVQVIREALSNETETEPETE